MPAAIPNRRSLQIRINETIWAKAKIIAEAESRNLNSQLEYFIKQGVAAYEAEHGPVEVPGESDA